jgi:hypothetical protein
MQPQGNDRESWEGCGEKAAAHWNAAGYSRDQTAVDWQDAWQRVVVCHGQMPDVKTALLNNSVNSRKALRALGGGKSNWKSKCYNMSVRGGRQKVIILKIDISLSGFTA